MRPSVMQKVTLCESFNPHVSLYKAAMGPKAQVGMLVLLFSQPVVT